MPESEPETKIVNTVLLPDLCEGTRLVIWGFRSCAIGHSGCCTLARSYRRSFGDGFPSVLANMLTFTQMIGYHGARKVRMSVPGCPHVTGDELLIVAVVNAVQNEDAALRDAHLTWLLGRPPVSALSMVASELGRFFLTAGPRVKGPEQGVEVYGALKAPRETAHFVWEGGRA